MELDPRRIPDFVWRRLPEAGFGVPLLLFHRLDPEELTERLEWLRGSGYRSLTAREVEGIARGELPVPRRAVALTFDDGVHNHWAVVAPLLKRHGFSGIAFVVPRLLGEGPPRPTIESAPADRAAIGRSRPGDDAVERYLRWSEVLALDREQALEIESHTWDHAQVFTSDRILDFQHPLPDGSPRYPWLWSACGEAPGEPLWGAPVYPMAPRMAGRRYHDDRAFRDRCRRFVAIRGERGFFADVTWRQELQRMVDLERARHGPGRLESLEETWLERLQGLRRAREVLRDRLGREVSQVALPWSRAAGDAPRLIAAAGYRVGYTSERPSWRLRGGADSRDLARLEGYWLASLPGAGRVSLARRIESRIRRHLPLVSR